MQHSMYRIQANHDVKQAYINTTRNRPTTAILYYYQITFATLPCHTCKSKTAGIDSLCKIYRTDHNHLKLPIRDCRSTHRKRQNSFDVSFNVT